MKTKQNVLNLGARMYWIYFLTQQNIKYLDI